MTKFVKLPFIFTLFSITCTTLYMLTMTENYRSCSMFRNGDFINPVIVRGGYNIYIRAIFGSNLECRVGFLPDDAGSNFVEDFYDFDCIKNRRVPLIAFRIRLRVVGIGDDNETMIVKSEGELMELSGAERSWVERHMKRNTSDISQVCFFDGNSANTKLTRQS
jgi:hypothetical protein